MDKIIYINNNGEIIEAYLVATYSGINGIIGYEIKVSSLDDTLESPNIIITPDMIKND